MDLATSITFGESVGFVKAGKDINGGMLHNAQESTRPWLFVSLSPRLWLC